MEITKDVCSPLMSYDDVLSWKCNDKCWAEKVRKINRRTKYCYSNYGYDQSNHSGSNIQPTIKLCAQDVPRTLICHDMKGGYLEDRFVDDVEANDPYRFYHWSSVDIFVYFSHYFVTIPPVGWINAGHLHGVPVLGTLITENEAGEEMCRSILGSRERINVFTRKLAELCEHYGFDGYLLNIENKIDTDLVENLVNFVKLLKEDLTAVCAGRDTYVIWYDAVIAPSGELKWQNQLNQSNKKFFDVCNGIFLNYCWTEKHLTESLEFAGARRHDVYVGVDVFGRGTVNGGFRSDMPMEMIRSFGFSAAIFAPGWTHEVQSEKEGDDFVRRELALWRNLRPFLYTYGPSTLPFRTTFCHGYGQGLYKEGNVCSEAPWFNLSKQNYQPTCCACTHKHELPDTKDAPDSASCISVHVEEAFEDGSCLKLSSCCQDNRINRLLACNFTSEEGEPFYITIAYKFLQECGQFELIVLAEETDMVEPIDFRKCSKTAECLERDRVSLSVVSFVLRGDSTLTLELIASRSQDYLSGWSKRTYKLSYTGNISLKEICFKTSNDCCVLLGLLEITAEK